MWHWRAKVGDKGCKYPVIGAWSIEWDLGHGFEAVIEGGEQLQTKPVPAAWLRPPLGEAVSLLPAAFPW